MYNLRPDPSGFLPVPFLGSGFFFLPSAKSGLLSCPHLWQMYKSSPPSLIGHSQPQLSQITSVSVTTSLTELGNIAVTT